jgi:cell division protein FtsI (penicillin-binding protein 3)
VSIKKIIVNRVIALYLLTLLGALLIVGRILQLQLIKGEELRSKAEHLTYRYESIEPNRGEIYSHNGTHVLATSVPYYEIRMDVNSDALTEAKFAGAVDSLAYCLSSLFGDKSTNAYKKELISARRKGERYHLIKRQVSYQQLKKLKTFPIFRLGRFKGGLIVEQSNRRILPHQMLAARTIGYLSEGESGNVVGIEGAYDHYLKGVRGYRLMQKTAGNMWIPLSDNNEVEPEDGLDIISTIDINIQDVAENALLTQLTKHNAHHGCAVLMEVKTGEIRAIANLHRTENGSYKETFNYAIAESTEPGSTFKLASVIAALEDGYVHPDDTVETGKGSVRFYDKTIKDTREGGYGKITVARAFELSSNVGIAKIIDKYYKDKERKFVDRLYRMHLNEPLGLDIKGEGEPLIRYPEDPLWSGISLVMMSHGYEVQMTPLQILAFYNAVANDGAMVRPRLVSEISFHGRTIRKSETEVIDNSICSASTIRKVKKMLEGVVDSGTAMNLRNNVFRIAGKTGTAQIANEKYGYQLNSMVSYQASFVGYFPADDPRYSCIVVVNAPSSNVYYGNVVAGPVFWEIASKVYATNIEIQEDPARRSRKIVEIPYSKNGSRDELDYVAKYLNIPVEDKSSDHEWIITKQEEGCITFNNLPIIDQLVPNVAGMGLSDAMYLLGNSGLHIQVTGKGRVVRQSIPPGTKVREGETIVLTMSMP